MVSYHIPREKGRGKYAVSKVLWGKLLFVPAAEDAGFEKNRFFRQSAGIFLLPAGDINGDSQVDVADVMSLAQLIVNGSTDTQYDFNRDGFLNVLDVMTLAQQIVNQTVSR